jgi:hypoxanthine phosphoribosyltransferase
MGRPSNFLNVSYLEMDHYARALARWIRKEHGKPGTIVYIERGGLIPARILSDALPVSDVVGVKAVHYEDVGVASSHVRVGRIWRHFKTNGFILVVDDITDSGKTMRAVTKLIEGISENKIVTCTLLHKPHSIFTPDFYYRTVANDTWVIFPHEIAETEESLRNRGDLKGLEFLKRSLVPDR